MGRELDSMLECIQEMNLHKTYSACVWFPEKDARRNRLSGAMDSGDHERSADSMRLRRISSLRGSGTCLETVF